MKIQLGVNPIFTIAENENDLTYASLLLSNHLANQGEQSIDRKITTSENCFLNESLSNVLKSDASFATKQDSFSLLLQEGFDTNKLYGIAFLTEQFLFDNLTKFPEAVLIFITNQFLNDSEVSIEDLLPTFRQYPHCIIEGSTLSYAPEQVLTTISEQFQLDIHDASKIKPNHLPSSKAIFSHYTSSQTKSGTPTEYSHAGDCSFIFRNVNSENVNTLFDQVKKILLAANGVPRIIILSPSTSFQQVQQVLEQEKIISILQLVVQDDQQGYQQVNAFIDTFSTPFVLVDESLERYSIFELLIKKSSYTNLRTTSIHQSELQHHALQQILAKEPIESMLFFRKSDWLQVDKYRMDAPTCYSNWDLAIRIVQATQQSCMVISSVAASQSTFPFTEQDYQDGFDRMIQHYKPLIESFKEDISAQLAKEHYQSLTTSKKLQSTIANLNVMISHSHDEVKSLHQMASQLHQRIEQFEQSFYFRLRTKVSRIKKIFFKKKSPGTGSLKRILQFIRFSLSKAGFGLVRKIMANISKRIYLKLERRPVQINFLDELRSSNGIHSYQDWILNKLERETLLNDYDEHIDAIQFQPKISIIVPVYNTPLKYLRECIDSVLAQQYGNWELCIADDCSSEKKVKKLLHAYSVKDARIKVVYRTENGHISAASNSALDLATGEYILLLDHDDLLTPNCTWEIVKCLHQHPDADLIYSDEDKINEQHIHQQAHFKPDWAPDNLLSRNYLGHVVVLKKNIVDQIGGFRLGFEGSQDYDLLLRATEICKQIIHIPKVLYHWRIHQLSAAQSEDVKPYAYIAAKKALEEALQRRGLKGVVKFLSGLRGYKIEYDIPTEEKVSIIIPTKDQKELLKNTVDSILHQTDYKNVEIIILNNNSTTKELDNFLNEYTANYPTIIRRIEAHFPFNFAKLMNMGVKEASGNLILLLNNDIETIHPDWLHRMVSHAVQPRVGAVGAKLLYPDDTIQHAGVIIGLGGIAGHSFVGAYKDDPGYFNLIQSINNYSAVTAACLLVRKEAYWAVGGMDETFEVEYNDVDFCLSLVEAGYNNVYLPHVELYHYESATRGHPHQSKVSYERHLREMDLFKNKWQAYIDHDPFYNPNLNRGVHDFSMDFSS